MYPHPEYIGVVKGETCGTCSWFMSDKNGKYKCHSEAVRREYPMDVYLGAGAARGACPCWKKRSHTVFQNKDGYYHYRCDTCGRDISFTAAIECDICGMIYCRACFGDRYQGQCDACAEGIIEATREGMEIDGRSEKDCVFITPGNVGVF